VINMNELEELEELEELKIEKKNVLDEAENDESVVFERYDITSYGADYDVDGLVKRIKRNDIFIPKFQREYIWNLNDASRFIESLLLGLPVPGVFLAKEQETNRLLVIDGQQRLRTLQFYYDGYFNPKPDQKTKRIFKLSNVQERFMGKTYEDLDENDRIRLNDAIIHATVIKQESPEDNDTSIYHVFERLNTGGRKLVQQEMREALYHGKLIDMLHEQNKNVSWRKVFGKPSNRLKDQELILRFLALYYKWGNYTKPMSDFITVFAKKNKNPDGAFIARCSALFSQTIDLLYEQVGDRLFRPERVLNAGVFDSVMVGLATRLELGAVDDPGKITEIYNRLIADADYNGMVSISTSDTVNVKGRLEKSIHEFSSL